MNFAEKGKISIYFNERMPGHTGNKKKKITNKEIACLRRVPPLQYPHSLFFL